MEQNRLGVIRITPAHMDTAKELLLLTVVGALIIAGVAVPVISYAAFAFCAALILLYNTDKGFCLLFFLAPFATVFKFSASSASCFTYLQLLLVGMAIFRRSQHFDRKLLSVLLVFILYVIFGSYLNVTLIIKQIMIPLTIYFFFYENREGNDKAFNCFVFGLLLSSVISLFMNAIPNMEKYIILDKTIELRDDVERMSGLYSDPNYYTVALMIAISGLLSRFLARRMGYWALIISLVLIIFGAGTVSKSFLGVLAIAYVYFLVCLYSRKRYRVAVVFTALGVVVVAAILFGRIAIFDNILARFEASEGNADSLMTNRNNIWKVYLDSIFGDNMLQTIFGHGIGAGYPKGTVAAHNTVLDFLYYYGFVGTVVFLFLCNTAAGKAEKRKASFVNAFSWVILAVLMMLLSCLQFFDFVFMIIMAIMNFRMDLRDSGTFALQENIK